MSNRTSKALWVALGVLSLISGVAIIGMPLALASLYGLPRWRLVLRIIGVRDVIIGTGLLISSDWPWFMWARCASDSIDALLIVVEGFRSGQLIVAALKFAVGCGVVVISGTLAWNAMKAAHSSGVGPTG
jgi:hypothetical protein